MGLDKKNDLQQNADDIDNTSSKEPTEQPVYALNIAKIESKGNEPHTIPFPWDCIKDHLYPETKHLCNIRNMTLQEQISTIRTYISNVFATKKSNKR